jgi:hypothetical protein
MLVSEGVFAKDQCLSQLGAGPAANPVNSKENNHQGIRLFWRLSSKGSHAEPLPRLATGGLVNPKKLPWHARR